MVSTDIMWSGTEKIPSKEFVCGYCSCKVASGEGIYRWNTKNNDRLGYVRICPNCRRPTFFDKLEKQTPGSTPGNPITHLPPDINLLYEEARASIGVGAYTGAVMICRTLLMYIAVSHGAKENLRFAQYVLYLAENHFIPPSGQVWVDHIRDKGNEAVHEVSPKTKEDAVTLITFIEMLLKTLYEFPAMVPPKPVAITK